MICPINRKDTEVTPFHIWKESSGFCMHMCAPVTHITFPLWWVQVSVTSLTCTQTVGGGRELMSFGMGPENRGGSGEVGSMACCSQDDIQCLEHAQTFPHMYLSFCRRRPAGLFDSTCCRDVLPKRVTNHGVPGLYCIGSPDNWFSLWEKGQGTGNMLLRNGEQEWDGQSDLDNPRLAWRKKKASSTVTFRQHREGIRMTKQSICESWQKTFF